MLTDSSHQLLRIDVVSTWQWWCPRCGYKQISSTLFTTWTLHRLYLRNKHGMLSHGIMLKSYFIILHFWTLHLLKTESKLLLGQSEFSSSNIRSLQRYWWYGFSIQTGYIVCKVDKKSLATRDFEIKVLLNYVHLWYLMSLCNQLRTKTSKFVLMLVSYLLLINVTWKECNILYCTV